MRNFLAAVFFPLALPPLLTTQPVLHQNPDTLLLSCLQKVARHQGSCVAPSPSLGPLVRSSSSPVENVQITGSVSVFFLPRSFGVFLRDLALTQPFNISPPLKYPKAVGSPRTLHSRLLLRERPWKKVESFVPLRVPPHPDVPLAPCPTCCSTLLQLACVARLRVS